jgi:uncharacterized membrane protein HdeD (DUF308 family)
VTPLDVILILAGLVVYFVPTWVAHRREAPNFSSIVVLNLFLGWSIIGWAIALALAVRDKPAQS